jgi:hypothetical protein
MTKLWFDNGVVVVKDPDTPYAMLRRDSLIELSVPTLMIGIDAYFSTYKPKNSITDILLPSISVYASWNARHSQLSYNNGQYLQHRSYWVWSRHRLKQEVIPMDKVMKIIQATKTRVVRHNCRTELIYEEDTK